MYRNTQHWIKTLEEKGELVRIKQYVNPHLEITEMNTSRLLSLINAVEDKMISDPQPNTGYDWYPYVHYWRCMRAQAIQSVS